MRNFILCACLLLLASCPQQPQPANTAETLAAEVEADTLIKPVQAAGPALEVWADPALLPALGALAPEFKKIYSAGYELKPLERGALLAPLEQDTSPVLPTVLCADQTVLEAYLTKGWLAGETLRTFAGDRLVLAERPGFGYKTPSLFDIYELRFEHFGLGEPTTLAGYFGEQALISDGGYKRIQDRIARYPSSAALVDALKQDEVQTVLVPASTAATNQINAWFVIGEDLHEDIRYQAAASQGHAADPGVIELLRFLAEEESVQTVLEGFGLVRRSMALNEEH